MVIFCPASLHKHGGENQRFTQLLLASASKGSSLPQRTQSARRMTPNTFALFPSFAVQKCFVVEFCC